MSTTASEKRAGRRWDGPAAPVVPDAAAPAKQRRLKAIPQEAVTPAEGNLESVKRRLQRLALDVHDGPMQNLAVIGFSLGDFRRKMHSLVPVDHHAGIDAGMEQIGAELVRVESELRALITALDHGTVSSVPVVEAIELEIAEFERRSAAEVELIVEGEVRPETNSQRIALQSVTRAALANVAKHAAAKNVTITLTGSPDHITLEIEDDGRGFRADAPLKPGRFGLAGMRDRVEMLGGSFDVQSRHGGPTRVTARLETWCPPASA